MKARIIYPCNIDPRKPHQHVLGTCPYCEAERLRAELAASRHELEGAKKAANAQARLIDSLEQQRAHLNAQRDQWIEARDTLDSERAANARLTEELAASREREARMQWQPIETAPKDGSLFLCWVYAVRYGETDEGRQYQQDVSQVDFCSWREGPSGLRDHGYFDPCCGQIADHQDVTHWMPLPASPRAALAEGAHG